MSQCPLALTSPAHLVTHLIFTELTRQRVVGSQRNCVTEPNLLPPCEGAGASVHMQPAQPVGGRFTEKPNRRVPIARPSATKCWD